MFGHHLLRIPHRLLEDNFDPAQTTHLLIFSLSNQFVLGAAIHKTHSLLAQIRQLWPKNRRVSEFRNKKDREGSVVVEEKEFGSLSHSQSPMESKEIHVRLTANIRPGGGSPDQPEHTLVGLQIQPILPEEEMPLTPQW
jgi:hypothetical protein